MGNMHTDISLIKYGNQGANQQHTICNPFLIHNQKPSKWGEIEKDGGGRARERNEGEGKRGGDIQVITSLFTGPMRAM